MSAFTCYFEDDGGDEIFEINVKRVEENNNVKIMVESPKTSNKKVAIKFASGNIQPIISYLRLLIRKHMEIEFDENLGWICIKHEGGTMRLCDTPQFKYNHKLHILYHKKGCLMRTMKEMEQTSTKFHLAVNKLEKINKKLKKVDLLHRQEVAELKTPYITKMVNEVSGIFEDLLILIQDAHEVTVT